MAAIGAVTVQGMQGRLFAARKRYAEIEPGPGYTGSVFVFGGRRGEDQRLVTTLRGLSIALALQAVAWDATEGTTISVTDGDGFTWTNVAVLRAASVISSDVIGHYLRTEWKLRVGV